MLNCSDPNLISYPMGTMVFSCDEYFLDSGRESLRNVKLLGPGIL